MQMREKLAAAYDAYIPLRDDGHTQRFIRLLDAEAWLDAAMMLVSEGWSVSIGEMRGINCWRGWLNDHNTPDGKAVRHVDAEAPTPAEALLAAIEKART